LNFHPLWYVLQDNVIHGLNYILRELESDLRQRIDKSLEHDIISTYYRPDIKTFDDFYNKVVEIEKKLRFEAKECTYPIRLMLFSLHNKIVSIIHIIKFENDVFVTEEKVRILISKYDADYYVLVMEGWMPKNYKIQERVAVNYRNGNVAKLPNHEKIEILTFIGKTKRSTNRGSDKSELHEIIREKQNDEESRILELRKIEGRFESGIGLDSISV
jgi:hypothetical protein